MLGHLQFAYSRPGLKIVFFEVSELPSRIFYSHGLLSSQVSVIWKRVKIIFLNSSSLFYAQKTFSPWLFVFLVNNRTLRSEGLIAALWMFSSFFKLSIWSTSLVENNK